jgi:hypothetical protein
MTQTIYLANGLYALAVLACPVGMGLMMWMMMRANKQTDHRPPEQHASPATDAELARLRAELDQLRAETRDRRQAPTDTPRTP